MTSVIINSLHSLSSVLLYPVIILLLFMVIAVLFLLGNVIVEYIADHRTLKANLPSLADDLHDQDIPLEKCIKESLILNRQKKILLELSKHTQLPIPSREALALEMLQWEKMHYAAILKPSELIVKLAPMLGLMGTLIPLGPGILALGQGDTATLADSLMTAFDTTVVGLLVAGAALLITSIRKRWYTEYAILLEALVECILERMKLDDQA